MSLKLGSNDTTLSAGSSVVKQMLLGSSPKFAAPVLDHVPGAAAAYSLRRLSNAYTGPVVKVRRSSDSTTADFTAAEVADGTLTAWVGAGDGFVHTWYDQSGNARNAVQTTAGAQPKVVSSGVVVTEGGKPAVQFDGGDTLSINAPPSVGQSASGRLFYAAVFSVDNLTSGRYVFQGSEGPGLTGSASTDYGLFLGSPSTAYFATGSSSDAGAFWAFGTLPLEQCVITGSLVASTTTTGAKVASINGVATSVAYAAKAPACTVAIIGSAVNGGSPFLGTISEIIVHTSDVSASRELAEGEIAWHYGLQSKLPYNHAYAPQALGGASQTVPTDSDAIAYLAAVAAADGAAVERSVAIAIDDFVKGLKADGLWSAIGSACVLAGARTVAGALVPLKGVAPTGYNWVASDYSRSLGLKGDGSTKYIDTNRLLSADPQDDYHCSVYEQTISSSPNTMTLLGGGGAGNGAVSLLRTTSAAYTRVRSATLKTGASVGNVSGFIGASRDNGAGYTQRYGGVDTAQVDASSTVGDYITTVFARGTTGGGRDQSSDARLSFYSIGASVDLALLDARVSALMAALGAAL